MVPSSVPALCPGVNFILRDSEEDVRGLLVLYVCLNWQLRYSLLVAEFVVLQPGPHLSCEYIHMEIF